MKNEGMITDSDGLQTVMQMIAAAAMRDAGRNDQCV